MPVIISIIKIFTVMADKQQIDTNFVSLNDHDDREELLQHNPSHLCKIKLAPINLACKDGLSAG